MRPFEPNTRTAEHAGRGPASADIADLAVGELQQRHRLVVDLGADRRELRRHRARLDDLAAEIMQHVELMDRELRQRPARRAVACTSARSWGELERALVGEIGLHEADAAELAGVDRLAACARMPAISRALWPTVTVTP